MSTQADADVAFLAIFLIEQSDRSRQAHTKKSPD